MRIATTRSATGKACMMVAEVMRTTQDVKVREGMWRSGLVVRGRLCEMYSAFNTCESIPVNAAAMSRGSKDRGRGSCHRGAATEESAALRG